MFRDQPPVKPGAPRSVAVTLRQKFGLFANIRPVKTFKRLTPNRDVDFVCLEKQQRVCTR